MERQDNRQAAAVERLQTRMLMDEYRSLPVGDRLQASHFALRASVSPIALEAHRRSRVDAAHGNRLRGL